MAQRKPEKLLVKKLEELVTTRAPVDRLRLAQEIAAAAESLQHNVVDEARTAGLTWTRIGAAFGMSKQAAQQRFKSAKPDQPSRRATSSQRSR